MLGFEYGFSLGAAGTALVIWEAQFGDFANNAQAIIDQYVAAGAHKLCAMGIPGFPPPVPCGRAASWLCAELISAWLCSGGAVGAAIWDCADAPAWVRGSGP